MVNNEGSYGSPERRVTSLELVLSPLARDLLIDAAEAVPGAGARIVAEGTDDATAQIAGRMYGMAQVNRVNDEGIPGRINENPYVDFAKKAIGWGGALVQLSIPEQTGNPDIDLRPVIDNFYSLQDQARYR